ncbi:MAG: 2-thiouracil desulfurase family protein [Thiohalophilus sp.]
MTVKNSNPTHRIRIGISSCLLGQEVRYDGGHKRNVYVLNNLGEYFEFVPCCPEVAIGMGVPRPPIRLVRRDDGVHAVGIEDPTMDRTEALRDYAFDVSGQLQDVSGYILKKDSPSCGMERVRVFDHNNVPAKTGSGIYAATLMECLPNLPFEEEGRLMDPVLRENFIERVFVYYRWQQMIKAGLSPSALVDFHSRHKFNVLAHDEPAYRRLGRLVADAGKEHLHSLAGGYIDILMQALKIPATRKRHTNVLMHVMGYLKNSLDGDDKEELLEVLEKYRLGQVPLIVPITLLKHHLRKYPQPYIDQQYYMNPYPEELMLRNSL